MSRRSATRPNVRITANGATFYLSSILPRWTGWGELKHSTRLNGSWTASWSIPNPRQWRHPALVYGARVEVMFGPIVVWAGTLEEPDWDQGLFIAVGACRDAETAMALDGAGDASTVPNTVIDAAIARGVLSWVRIGDFGDTPIGDANAGVVTVRSVLDVWAQKNGLRWKVNRRRELVIETVDETSPSLYILPGSGVLGSSSQERVDRVFVRYIDSVTGQRATASHPAVTPAGGVESPVDLVAGRAPMTAVDAQAEAEAIWQQKQGRSGFTNGITVSRRQVVDKGGPWTELALTEAGETACLLGVPDPRGIGDNTLFVIGETEYDWEPDDIQLNPVDMSARDIEAVLEQVGNLAVDAMAAATTQPIG